MGYNDFFKDTRTGSGGTTGNSTKTLASVRAHTERAENERTIWSHGFEHSEIYDEWARKFSESRVPSSYYDYFYSGQDIKVSIEGAVGLDANMPVVNLAYSINQQKAPVYGVWSYTYDAVMRGQRLVSGTFSVATRHPGYMKSMLSEAASSRSAYPHSGLGGVDINAPARMRPLTEDDRNLEKYWSRNIDPYLSGDGRNIFSVHPPFSIRIDFGLQGASVDGSNWGEMSSEYDKMYGDSVSMMDINERLLDPDSDGTRSCVILESVELKDMQTGFAPDGSVVVEVYQFFAREALTPSWV